MIDFVKNANFFDPYPLVPPLCGGQLLTSFLVQLFFRICPRLRLNVKATTFVIVFYVIIKQFLLRQAPSHNLEILKVKYCQGYQDYKISRKYIMICSKKCIHYVCVFHYEPCILRNGRWFSHKHWLSLIINRLCYK